MSCHGAASPTVGTVTATGSVVLVGNPNVGKSSLFNALTGARQDVRNAPGTTVEVRAGHWADLDTPILDVPGTYSLLARSPDEQVTVDALSGALPGMSGAGTDLVVVLMDATALARSLYLLAQVAQTGHAVVVALTMADVAAAAGTEVRVGALADHLGVPVVVIDPRSRRGLSRLAEVVGAALRDRPHVRGIQPDPAAPGFPGAGVVDGGRGAVGRARLHGSACGCPHDGAPRCCAEPTAGVVPDALATGAGPDALAAQLSRAEDLFVWVEELSTRLGAEVAHTRPTRSDRIDRVLLHPLAGLPVLGVVMWTLFQLATAVAAPLMTLADRLVTGPLSAGARAVLATLGVGGGWVEGLVVDGLLAGVGTVVSFVPLMALMFLAVAVLEDSGYLARAAFVADRGMRAIGLDGRAVLPLVVGFGCNLPALAATRTLPDARQRLVTSLLVPYTTCAARLAVYILLASVFFPDHAGTVIFGMYAASVALVIAVGLVLKHLLGTGTHDEPLLLVLPAYQRPRGRVLVVDMAVRVRAFVAKAGRIIVLTLTLVWALMAVPADGGTVGRVPVEDSLYGRTAGIIAPAFGPAGFDDWHASAALMTGFVAKEVVVGSFAQSYAVAEPADPALAGHLGAQLRATFQETSGGHGRAAALAFMVFVLAYTPCLATLAEQRRAIGLRPTLAALGAQLALAWVVAVAVFQVGRLLW